MARSGQAAAELLEKHGVEVVRADRSLGNDEDVSLLDGADVLVKSPGVPARRTRWCAAARDPDLERGRARLRTAAEPDPRGHRDEREDDDDRVARRDVPRRRRPVAVAGNVGRALERRRGAARRLDRLRAVELPARGRARVPAAGRGADQPRAGPPRPARHLRGLPRREAADLREPGRRGHGGRAARVRQVPGGRGASSSARPTRCRPSRGCPGAHNRENAAAATAAARAAGLPDEAIAEALRSFPGVAHRLELVAESDGVRFVNDSKATNTAAARRALAAYDVPLHVILGGSRKGESFDELAREVHGRAYLIGETRGRAGGGAGPRGRSLLQLRRPRDGASPRPPRRRVPARSCCSRPRARATTSSGLRAPRRGIQEAGAEPDRVKRGHLESNVLVLRHARPRRLRDGDGLQRDVGVGGDRRRQLDVLPQAPGAVRAASASRCSLIARAGTTGRCAHLAPACW